MSEKDAVKTVGQGMTVAHVELAKPMRVGHGLQSYRKFAIERMIWESDHLTLYSVDGDSTIKIPIGNVVLVEIEHNFIPYRQNEKFCAYTNIRSYLGWYEDEGGKCTGFLKLCGEFSPREH